MKESLKGTLRVSVSDFIDWQTSAATVNQPELWQICMYGEPKTWWESELICDNTRYKVIRRVP